jgi:hypothetical protein
MQRYTIYFICKLFYIFWVVPLIIRSANNCIYSIWYLSHRYCYLPLSWKSWNWFGCAVHTQTSSTHELMNVKLYFLSGLLVYVLITSEFYWTSISSRLMPQNTESIKKIRSFSCMYKQIDENERQPVSTGRRV